MQFKQKTFKTIESLSKDPEYDYFFDRMGVGTEVPTEFLEKLSEIMAEEFGIDTENEDKVLFFLRLACLSFKDK